MPNIYKKSIAKDRNGIMRPVRKAIPVADRRGVNRTKTSNKSLYHRHRPIAGITETVKDGTVKICIQRKLGGIGDVIMSTPIAQAFKEQFPNCEFTYATQPGVLTDILKNNPYIDAIVDFSTVNPDNYHVFADITSTGLAYEKATNPPKNRIDMFAEYVGIRLKNYKPTYVVTEEENRWSKEVLDKWFGERNQYKLIYLDISSVDQRRSWPAGHSVKLISEVVSLRKDVRFIINDFNRRLGHTWNYQNCIDVSAYGARQSAALINAADLFVGPDSGMLHIAGALEKPIVGIFGSTPAAARINHYKNAIAVETDLPCGGCWYKNCTINYACMTGLKPSRVREAVIAKLETNSLGQAYLKGKRIGLFTVTEDGETIAAGNALRTNLLAQNITASLNEHGLGVGDIIVEIINTNSLPKEYTNLLPKCALKVAYVIVNEERISKHVIQHLSNKYDLILSSSRHGVEKLGEAGLLQPVYSIGHAVAYGLSVSQPSQDVYNIGVISLKKSEKALTIIKNLTEIVANRNINVKVLTFNEDLNGLPNSIQTFNASVSNVDNFWKDINVCVMPDTNDGPYFLLEAAARGVIGIGIQSSSVSDIPDTVIYKTDLDILKESIEDVLATYDEQVKTVPLGREWVLKNCCQPQASLMANFIVQKLLSK